MPDDANVSTLLTFFNVLYVEHWRSRAVPGSLYIGLPDAAAPSVRSSTFCDCFVINWPFLQPIGLEYSLNTDVS